MLTVDLNCDMGEGISTDEAIYPLISSANIACGGHAGDARTMRASTERALQHGVAVGAHPSYPDRAGFGRADILETGAGKGDRLLSFRGLREQLARQIEALQGICLETGAHLHHVKPHGALYNRAAKDPAVARIIAETVKAAGDSILLYGLSGSVMRAAAVDAGLRFVSEAFADRTYRRDGTLTPRSEPDALIAHDATMLEQVLMIIRQGRVRAADGALVSLAVDTLCLHGDGPNAVRFATVLRRELDCNGIAVAFP
ncbi:MAG TPA: 5-oxoprolinase subunit PxpA [Puia sp.]|nr:5-oxoprolinase subunit PxpA [Puia sp.]